VTRSKEIGYQEFIEADISDEDKDKKDYNRVIRRQIIKRLVFFNMISELCIVGVIAVNDGIIIVPYMVIFVTFTLVFLFWIKDLTHYKMWAILIWPLKIWTFGLLYIQFFFRIDYIMARLPEEWLIVFGYIFKDQTLSYYGLVPMVLLFIMNCLQRSLLNLIDEKSWVVRDEDFQYIRIEKSNMNWFEKLWESFKTYFSTFSIRVYQMLAILWCMIHPSSLMVLILLCGVCGLFMQKDDFKKVFLIPIQFFGTIYISFQMVFNITYFFDAFAESQELFLIGIFKYCLFHDNALADSLDNISHYDLVASRALRFALDLLIFSILTRIYFLNRSGVKMLEHQIGTPKEFYKEESKQEHEETKERLTDKEAGDKPSFLEMSTLRPPKTKTLKKRIINFFRKVYEGLLLNTAKFILVFLFFASIIIIDGVHLGYFILFLLFSLLSNRISEKIWKVQMAYTILVIILLYIYQVLSGYFIMMIDDDSQVLSEYIGVKRYKNSLIWEYKEHLILILSLFLQKIVFESDIYKRLSKDYSDDDFERKSPGQIKRKLDIFSKFFLKYGLLLCYASLLFVGFYENPSLLSVIYLVILALIIMIELMANDQKKALDTLNNVWPIFILLNFLILTLRYLYQIGFFSLLLSYSNLEQILPLQDIGLDKVFLNF